ncbi:MAG: DNA repair protein RadC [Oscillospiraceae bacterium]|jgi:DNA repair protein RadC|nr:DNA repair protein RadC [Oscillospiraceae bacterium]
MSVHDGHRDRLRERFKNHGLDSFDDHTVLELLLFHAIPRRDTNETAHLLLEKFGTLADVFDAPREELCRVPGVGETAALLLKLLPPIARRYYISRTEITGIVNSARRAGEYLLPYFFGEQDEVVYIMCLDAKCKVLCCKLLFRGGVNSANVNVRKLVETALSFNATSVILAHNHTSGIALPSPEDKTTTKRIMEALSAVDIVLADHIVVADDDFISFSDNGFFR